MVDDTNKIPERSSGDGVHAGTKALLSMIPVVGGPLVELFQFVIQPPLERRRDEWMRSIGDRLKDLEENGLDLESLQSNEQFVSIVLQATQGALRTHKEEKLTAFRNAVVNVAKGQSPDEAVQDILLGLVDQFSELHLRVLKVLHSPTVPETWDMGGLETVLQLNIPSLTGQRELTLKIVKDLFNNGLIKSDIIGMTLTGAGLRAQQTTIFGVALIKLIS